eukprot:CAMPEP_0119545898 /NCGR_PEP_ID=MMETSP1352-20130426/516_1 /TAXON_ID=265584 /ORGANISM="Stauroneis constricta, Strain CCMP1120" /LENGTH=487 /DNA_ID=CAMNT_0007590517 /DNA_START=115 /DNA_END=1578 /DNA_ORIENTATION=+
MNTSSLASSRKNARRQQLRRKPMADQRFSSYLVFGLASTLCCGTFLFCYAIILLAAWPLITSNYHHSARTGADAVADHPLQLKSVVKQMRVPEKVKEAELRLIDEGKEEFEKVASAFKQKFHNLRANHGVTDEALLQEAQRKFDLQQQSQKDQKDNLRHIADVNAAGSAANGDNGDGSNNKNNNNDASRIGFVVLGMHRSGTSMLSGLLVTSCGYNVGGPLIGQAFDNEKGFFERIDVVLQNDEFMYEQGVSWANNPISFDPEKALEHYNTKQISFKQGKRALPFLNNPNNAPWLQKDPRMCITLKTWLHLLNNEPAVVFTYRHPLEVAMSLSKREENFSLQHGLRLWIVYNMRAIQNSKGLCIVTSSNNAVLADPLNEVQRISDELTSKCGVPAPPRSVTLEDVEKFVDPNLQHNKKENDEKAAKLPVIATYNDGKCVVHDFESDTKEGTPTAAREQKLYGQAMRIYCDFESGKAYEDDYQWPQLD